jgi:peptide/nickel transport system substrate-binding protein
MLQAVYMSDSPNNETFWKRPEFDRLLTQAQGELDQGRRKEMFHEMQLMLWEDGGALIPMFANRLYASSSKVDGLVRSPLFTAFRAAEQLYFV